MFVIFLVVHLLTHSFFRVSLAGLALTCHVPDLLVSGQTANNHCQTLNLIYVVLLLYYVLFLQADKDQANFEKLVTAIKDSKKVIADIL
jgi:hypothetical protein